MKKLLAIVLSLIMVLALFVGCNKDDTPANSPAADSGSSPAAGGSESSSASSAPAKDTLVVGFQSDPSSLDPFLAADPNSDMMVLNIFDPMVRRTNNNEIVPCLAESWELSADGLYYDFKIRQGVKFHNGYDFTADDVVFTFNKIITCPSKAFFGDICSGAEKIDETTVRMHMYYPERAFLQYLARGIGVVSEKYYNEVGEDGFGAAPIGTGAWKLVDWQRGSKILWERNDDYWMGPAPIRTIEFRVIPEGETRLVALETGEADIMYSATGLQKISILQNSSLDYTETAGAIYSFIGFNVTIPPFDDIRLRQALSMSVNREDIIEGAFDGLAFPLRTYLPPQTQGNPGEDKLDLLPYDPDAARALIAEAFPDGVAFDFSCSADSTKIATLLQAQWKEIGVDMNPNIMEGGPMMADLRQGLLECFYFGAMDMTNDATILLGLLTEAGIGILNNFAYINPEYEKLFEDQNKEMDPAKRQEIVKEMLNIAAHDAPLIPTHILISNAAYKKGLHIMIDTDIMGAVYWEYYWE